MKKHFFIIIGIVLVILVVILVMILNNIKSKGNNENGVIISNEVIFTTRKENLDGLQEYDLDGNPIEYYLYEDDPIYMTSPYLD